jgi:hypothetical protein
MLDSPVAAFYPSVVAVVVKQVERLSGPFMRQHGEPNARQFSQWCDLSSAVPFRAVPLDALPALSPAAMHAVNKRRE